VDVSVVLPVYNEAGHLQKEVDRISAALDRSPYSYELLIVDDGSTDGSADVIDGIDRVRVIRFAENRGSGSARRAGTQLSRGRVVVWTDADMSYPNDEIPKLVKELEGYDQVVGARTSEEGTHKLFRVPTKWVMRKLASFLTETKIPDLNSGLRAFRRDVALQYLHLLPKGFSCVTTLTMAFLSNGYSVKYIPIDYATRAGSSKFHWWADTRRYLLQVVRMTLLYNPLRALMPIVLTLLAVGTVKMGFDVFYQYFSVETNTLVILLSASALAILALLADLLVQINKKPEAVLPAALVVREATETQSTEATFRSA
jgi:glycosyltransferase involved in cell wall biosynthesis